MAGDRGLAWIVLSLMGISANRIVDARLPRNSAAPAIAARIAGASSHAGAPTTFP